MEKQKISKLLPRLSFALALIPPLIFVYELLRSFDTAAKFCLRAFMGECYYLGDWINANNIFLFFVIPTILFLLFLTIHKYAKDKLFTKAVLIAIIFIQLAYTILAIYPIIAQAI